MTKFQIDVVSDTVGSSYTCSRVSFMIVEEQSLTLGYLQVCPWCYVGKNRLDKAIELHKASNPDDTFNTTWYPFYLNPDAPPSIDKEEYYHRKFGAQRTK